MPYRYCTRAQCTRLCFNNALPIPHASPVYPSVLQQCLTDTAREPSVPVCASTMPYRYRTRAQCTRLCFNNALPVLHASPVYPSVLQQCLTDTAREPSVPVCASIMPYRYCTRAQCTRLCFNNALPILHASPVYPSVLQ